MIRSATSPRFAIRIFLNTLPGPYREEPLTVLHRLTALHIDIDDFAVVFGVDFVHQLHRFDDAEDLALLDARADVDEGRGAGFRRPIERADDRRLDDRQFDVDFFAGRR